MDEPLIPTEANARKAVMGGILLIAIGLGMIYFFAIQPIREALATGHTTYQEEGVLLGPLCVYIGLLALTGKFRDGQIRKLNSKGKPTFTKKGWIALGGALAVLALTMLSWYGYLHSMGFTERSGY